MSDRTLVYPSEQPTDTLWLTQELNKMIAIGYLAQGVLGTATVVDGLGCIPTVPASLAVQIQPGSIYQQEPIDVTSYASLGVDTVDQIVKQGIILPITSLTLSPPGTAGQSINYLIEAQILEQDINNIVLSYFNSANPAIPFTGPGGSGTAQPTLRQCTLSLVAKAGVAATSGTQVTPAPDAGYVGLWVVVVANGATQLTSSQISQYATAPFISVKLPQVPGYVQGGTWAWAVDGGTANQIIVNMTPVPAAVNAGFEIRVKKTGSASTGAMTIIVNGASSISVVNADGTAISGGAPMPANFLARLVFDGTSWRWTNAPGTTAVGSLGASSGEGINVTGAGVVALNYPALSVEATVANTDLWSFYSQLDVHHRVLSSTQFLAWLRTSLPIQALTAPVVYYVNASTGLDTNSGLTVGSPFATIQKALSTVAGFNMNGYSVTINLATSVTYAPFTSVPLNGSGSVSIIGNPASPSQCLIRNSAGEGAVISHPGYFLSGMKFQCDTDGSPPHSGIGIRVTSVTLTLNNCEFGSCSYAHMSSAGGALVALYGTSYGFSGTFINITGSTPCHLYCSGGSFYLGGITMNISNAMSFSTAFAFCQAGGAIFQSYSTINNASSATGYRYAVQLNGVIISGGQAPSWPGNTAGYFNTGGQVS